MRRQIRMMRRHFPLYLYSADETTLSPSLSLCTRMMNRHFSLSPHTDFTDFKTTLSPFSVLGWWDDIFPSLCTRMMWWITLPSLYSNDETKLSSLSLCTRTIKWHSPLYICMMWQHAAQSVYSDDWTTLSSLCTRTMTLSYLSVSDDKTTLSPLSILIRWDETLPSLCTRMTKWHTPLSVYLDDETTHSPLYITGWWDNNSSFCVLNDKTTLYPLSLLEWWVSTPPSLCTRVMK